jgi:hypothetical protein
MNAMIEANLKAKAIQRTKPIKYPETELIDSFCAKVKGRG